MFTNLWVCGRFIIFSMLKKENRLTKKKEIEKVFQEGKSSFDKITGIKCLENKNKINRFAIVISSKISKKAVTRNRKKNQLREIIKINLNRLKPGFDFFVLGLSGIIDADYHDIEKSLLGHFRKLRRLK